MCMGEEVRFAATCFVADMASRSVGEISDFPAQVGAAENAFAAGLAPAGAVLNRDKTVLLAHLQ
eukprot:11189464-Lingulodinium_polyedra.AAC.1